MGKITLDYSVYDAEFDTLVAGGGTAGTIAACAAAREGAKTILLEREYALGGTASLGQTTPRMTNHMSQQVTNSALIREVQEDLIKIGGGSGEIWFNPQLLKLVLENLCEKYGVKILYGADLLAAEKEGERVTAAIFQTVGGALGVKAKSFIDCTGNAQLSMLAKVPIECGDSSGRNQPMTLRFAVAGADIARTTRYMREIGQFRKDECGFLEMASLWDYPKNPFTDLFHQALADGVIEKRDGNYFQSFATACYGEDVMYFNCPESAHIRNATDAESITEMVLYSRKAAERLWKFMKTYVPGFENSRLLSFAEIPGVRESRRIVGDYLLTEDDFQNRAKFADAVAQTAYPIDIHDSHCVELKKMQPGEYYEIPYRSLVAKNCPNLLVAGRCISATFVAQSSMRIQMVCMALGEAAGIASAMNPENAHAVDGAEVRKRMIERGGEFVS